MQLKKLSFIHRLIIKGFQLFLGLQLLNLIRVNYQRLKQLLKQFLISSNQYL